MLAVRTNRMLAVSAARFSAARMGGLMATSGILCSSASLAISPVLTRSFHASRPSGAFEEFFDASRVDGAARQPTGRPWDASELRTKSFEDLHKLWFVCLKERNMLNSERLYYRQVAQTQPEPSRLMKVRATMRAIKVVIGERARATAMQKADVALASKAEDEASRLSARLRDSLRDPVDRLLRPAVRPVARSVESPALAEVSKGSGKDPRLVAAAAVKANAKDAMVTYKKFGRKYVVPAHMAPDKPTIAQQKREKRTRTFFAKRKAMLDAPPTLPPTNKAYIWATGEGKKGGAGGTGRAVRPGS